MKRRVFGEADRGSEVNSLQRSPCGEVAVELLNIKRHAPAEIVTKLKQARPT